MDLNIFKFTKGKAIALVISAVVLIFVYTHFSFIIPGPNDFWGKLYMFWFYWPWAKENLIFYMLPFLAIVHVVYSVISFFIGKK